MTVTVAPGPSQIIGSLLKHGLVQLRVLGPLCGGGVADGSLGCGGSTADVVQRAIESFGVANKWLDERAARERDLAPGQYVTLCVSDTGPGMPGLTADFHRHAESTRRV